jgi:two-component system phosphate regulon sensor histidine kinase PhoR
MKLFRSVSPSRRLLALFLILTVAPAAGLAWLGWRLLEQARALEAQRTLERQEYTADLVAGALSRRISETRRQLTQPEGASPKVNPSDAVIVTFQQHYLRTIPPGRLLYYPVAPQDREAPEAPFLAGERLEFNQRDYAGAIKQFRSFGESKDPALRAGAQFRIARNQRKLGNIQQALATYDKLADYNDVFFAGIPAELAARQAQCILLDELDRKEDLHHKAESLSRDLENGRFQLTRPVFQLYTQQISQWLEQTGISDPGRLALSAATEWLWQEWQKVLSGGSSLKNTSTVRLLDRSFAILSEQTPESLTALIAGPDCIESEWLLPAMQSVPSESLSVMLQDDEGYLVNAQAQNDSGRRSVRLASETGLPWTVVVAGTGNPVETEAFTSRRRLLLAGLVLAAILVVTTGYALTRSLAHELDAARLKSDFVAAVSHEFRTPLATLQQLTENLADGRVSTDERRSAYYQTQRRSTNRLSRLVERLLDFGRMEAGALRYHFEPVNVGSLARDVVDEFANVAATSGHKLTISVDSKHPEVYADPEALGQALWNLIDNAIKYSPEQSSVEVDVRQEDGWAAIRVRDTGPGIEPQDRKRIFRKFFRGSAAAGTHKKGAGIGLAMVDYIVRAHQGRIRVESEPGTGSAFTILLKTEAS